jgi:hypothetical protein
VLALIAPVSKLITASGLIKSDNFSSDIYKSPL